MQHLRPFLYLGVIAIVLISFLFGTVTASVAQTSSCTWSDIPSPSPGSFNNYLYSVSALSKNNAWTVGHADPQTLIEHWNGTNWSSVPSPSPGASNLLQGIDAFSANNIWAVGNTAQNGGFPQTLIEHWNGKKWHVSASPSPGTEANELFGIAVLTANDIWTVGETGNGSSLSQTLIEHWDGITWSVVPSPNAGTGSNVLTAITAVAANDIWAVGDGSVSEGSPDQTLTEHWDGIAWSIVPSPNSGQGDNFLNGVVAIATDDVWTVGATSSEQALIEHWDGTSWEIVTPAVSTMSNSLSSVTWLSSANVWAVGEASSEPSSSTRSLNTGMESSGI